MQMKLPRSFRILSVATLCVFVKCSTAGAVPISYNDIAGTTINFDSLAGSASLGSGEQLSHQFSSLGVVFEVPNFGAYASVGVLASTQINSDPNVIWISQGGGSGGTFAQGMNINFQSPISKVGVLFITSLNSIARLSVYSGPTLLESVTVQPNSGTGHSDLVEAFLAVSNENITRAVLSSANLSGQNWNFTIDDLKFTQIPEPNAIFLITFTMASVCITSMRRLAGAELVV
jgi:hypothetical protein